MTYEYEERAAIIEYEANKTREEAERLAKEEEDESATPWD